MWTRGHMHIYEASVLNLFITLETAEDYTFEPQRLSIFFFADKKSAPLVCAV